MKVNPPTVYKHIVDETVNGPETITDEPSHISEQIS